MHEDDQSLEGAWAVVTGSSAGIGEAIAMELAGAGANVLVHGGHNQQRATAVAERIVGLGLQSRSVVFDLETLQGQDELIEAALAWAPRIDIWINNAGCDVLTGDAAKVDFEHRCIRLMTLVVEREIGARLTQRLKHLFQC